MQSWEKNFLKKNVCVDNMSVNTIIVGLFYCISLSWMSLFYCYFAQLSVKKGDDLPDFYLFMYFFLHHSWTTKELWTKTCGTRHLNVFTHILDYVVERPTHWVLEHNQWTRSQHLDLQDTSGSQFGESAHDAAVFQSLVSCQGNTCR